MPFARLLQNSVKLLCDFYFLEDFIFKSFEYVFVFLQFSVFMVVSVFLCVLSFYVFHI